MATATKMRFGVVIFPGTNCDTDTWHALHDEMGAPVDYIWHEETDVSGYDCIAFADRGGLVLGICNGFQVLLEAGMLPGAMMRNAGQTFVCKYVHIRPETRDTPFTRAIPQGAALRIPVAHGEGNYYCDSETLDGLKRNHQIVFRYCTPEGEVTPEASPNGALDNIAGLCNKERNVMGMMPHPERCTDPLLGSSDGRKVWESLLAGH